MAVLAQLQRPVREGGETGTRQALVAEVKGLEVRELLGPALERPWLTKIRWRVLDCCCPALELRQPVLDFVDPAPEPRRSVGGRDLGKGLEAKCF